MDIRSAEIKALLEGVLYGLRPITDIYNVKMDGDELLADKLQEIITSLNGKVKTVNGISPDEKGNVQVTASGSGGEVDAAAVKEIVDAYLSENPPEDGKSAYEIAKEAGFSGTEADFAELLLADSIKQYGAVGDGVTDDTAAFQQALAAERKVFVPGGTYILSGEILIDSNCELRLSQDTVLKFTQTSGNCISMKMSASLRGNHATVVVPYEFTGNVVYVSSTLNESVVDFEPWNRWSPSWKAGRYLTDLNITKPDSRGFHYSVDGTCTGTAVYISADGSATSTFIWGLNFSGLRIAGGFSYGIRAQNFNEGWNHEMRLEAFIDACEIGVSLEDCNNAYVSATIQPRRAYSLEQVYSAYAKHGIQLIRSRNTDLSGSRVWDWNSENSLWAAGNRYQHISMVGNCSGTILNDFFYYEMPSYDIRSLIYTDTAGNLEKITILQEPFTRWFKPVEKEPYFNDGYTEKRLLLKEEFDECFQTERIAKFTNLLPAAIDNTGAVFNGIGYKNGYGWAQDGVTLIEGSHLTCTGFIPCSAGDGLYVEGMSFKTGSDECRIILYDASFNKIMFVNRANLIANASYYFLNNYTETEDGFSVDVVREATAYVTITVYRSTVSETPVVSVNEEIRFAQEGFLADGIKVKGSEVILSSPGGKSFGLAVSDDGTLSINEIAV